MSRLHHTAADYAAIAIAPVLIFVMLFSLASFLCIVLYSGGYSGALVWTMLMYTMGATAVARITIEHDRQYSSLYAIALGVATVFVLIRYVGDPIFSIGIVWVVGYLADKIVHDCTIVDDAVDSSGQGLVDSGLSFLKLRRQQKQQTDVLPSNAATDANDASAISQSNSKRSAKNPAAGHQPGRTVLWLALGALPLFGLGQFFLGGDSKTWNLARILLTLYLFSALSLLVVTSFLNLRRYLRQRQTEMPLDATVAWLAGGIVIIGVILMIAYIAPLPGKAVASLKAPEFLTNRSPLSASEYGWGDEGAEISDENDAKSSETSPDGSPSGETKPGAKAGGQKGNREDGPAGSDPGGKKQGKGQDPGSDQPAGGEKNESSKSPSPAANDSKNSGTPPQSEPGQPGPKSGDQGKAPPNQSPPSPSESSSKTDPPNQSQSKTSESNAADAANDDSQSGEPENSSSDTDAAEESQSPDSQEQEPQTSEQSKSNSESPSDDTPNQNTGNQQEPLSARTKPPPDRSPSLGGVFSTMAGMLKWVIFLALFAFIAFFVVRNLDAILAWWDNLFADENREPSAPKPIEKKSLEPDSPPRPFASFRNPAGDPDPRRVVVVTFQALEAWCREQGVERSPDETPSEFVRRVAVQFPTLGQSAVQVVDAYNRIVYGRAAALQDDVEAANSVWQVFAGGTRTS
ncbi:hypothetical protein RISK_002026 [Rhodopirellula islandica]|uniref:Protein-glutamine gamma-glutamyltransferase-like C-terminal domain-containing protein n=1 Tax=Rhodopirellula islandica TaxID=595434 RepID=A0A0J1BHZ9_RHOIS|nr:DUF4129 domain-containing protein [Rhodopirellula islandica]KLU06175.1 hypothetical protein RISK_002026 [Rhodopirellula islandica]